MQLNEIIFRTTKIGDRLFLELMSRGTRRIGEVLKLTPDDNIDRKLRLRQPKNGRGAEKIFLPQKVADRLKEYVRAREIGANDLIFPICYEATRTVVKKVGKLVDIDLRPHDLRRHAATFANQSGVSLEIISKIILRHSNLSTTQLYSGKISDIGALKWIESLYS